ncbi:N-acetylmuramoyl-L-alanine amidase [Paracoccaceae bacterium]|nr:N-acetylmuramoyl-L-alanine amidase [Paracoccaceae bacterium]MDB3860883.1 N-acetylmuramoyl-L-alanine amidase [Paracoccaceae bacterium]
MKPLKVLFLFFLRVTILGLNTAFIPLAQIGNASNFNDGYGLRLKLDESVPFKVYSLNYPNRIVLELNTETHKTLNDFDIKSSPLLGEIKFKKLVDGWAAITIYIGKPAKVQNLTMKPNKLDASKVELSFELFPIVQYEFDRIVEIFSGTISNEPAVMIENNLNDNKNNKLIVVIDPGHGGLDPGAQVKTIREADLMLSLAQVVAEEVQRLDNTEVILTRTSDQFTSLDKRLMLAVQAGADLFISLHADTVEKGKASGATVYTLSQEASDQASARLAARHGGNELISGVDLTGADTTVTTALMGLLRQENIVRSNAFSKSIIKNLEYLSIKLNPKPSRKANFSVLKLPSVPSVLIETGFMSTSSDLQNLQDRDWAEKFALAISSGILEWVAGDQLLSKNRMQ